MHAISLLRTFCELQNEGKQETMQKRDRKSFGRGGGGAVLLKSFSDILAQRGGHLIGKSSGDDHAVRLSGTRPKNDTKPIQIVTSRPGVHHLHSTASQTKGHRPYGTGTRPVHQRIHLGEHVLRPWSTTGTPSTRARRWLQRCQSWHRAMQQPGCPYPCRRRRRCRRPGQQRHGHRRSPLVVPCSNLVKCRAR